jgi:hypothetical protein
VNEKGKEKNEKFLRRVFPGGATLREYNRNVSPAVRGKTLRRRKIA